MQLAPLIYHNHFYRESRVNGAQSTTTRVHMPCNPMQDTIVLCWVCYRANLGIVQYSLGARENFSSITAFFLLRLYLRTFFSCKYRSFDCVVLQVLKLSISENIACALKTRLLLLRLFFRLLLALPEPCTLAFIWRSCPTGLTTNSSSSRRF